MLSWSEDEPSAEDRVETVHVEKLVDAIELLEISPRQCVGKEGDFDDVDYSDDAPGDETFATLQTSGPQSSVGSSGHPDSCMPCTFYCFTKRGCNRNEECRFCHLAHTSKLQQRRQAWKKQQREKRKCIRERVAQDAMIRATLTPADVQREVKVGVERSVDDRAKQVSTRTLPLGDARHLTSRLREEPEAAFSGHFNYNLSPATLTIGQHAELWPQLNEKAMNFRLTVPLPVGLALDTSTGVIHGFPVEPIAKATSIVEATLASGLIARASVEFEVVDFTNGGFVIGGISEIEPGKFMLLLYVPEHNDGTLGSQDGVSEPCRQFASNMVGAGHQARPRLANCTRAELGADAPFAASAYDKQVLARHHPLAHPTERGGVGWCAGGQ